MHIFFAEITNSQMETRYIKMKAPSPESAESFAASAVNPGETVTRVCSRKIFLQANPEMHKAMWSVPAVDATSGVAPTEAFITAGLPNA